MSGKNRTIRVFIASPGDVQRERDSLLGVVNELNRTFDVLLPRAGIRVELLRWETDAFPGMGRPQGVINSQIKDYDILIGIFWKRFGTPTGEAASGTEEEFQIAFKNWERRGRPQIMLYFNLALIRPPQSSEEIEQLSKLVEFKKRLSRTGLTWNYDGDSIFTDTIRPHLIKVIGQLIHADGSSTKKRMSPTVPPPISADETVTMVEIGPQDACYGQQSKYVGRTGVVIEAEQQDDWLRGTFRFDTPLFDGDDGIYKFLQFRVKSGTELRKRPNKSTRTRNERVS